MQHPDEGLIHAWIDDGLPADEAARVAAHVTSCATCTAATAEARGLIAASSRIVTSLDAAPGNVLPAPARRPLRWWATRGVPSAIAAALLVGIGFRMRPDQREMVSSREFRTPVALESSAPDSAISPLMSAPPAPQAKVAATTSARVADAAGVAAPSPMQTAPVASDALPRAMITPPAAPSMQAASSRPVTERAARGKMSAQLGSVTVTGGASGGTANRADDPMAVRGDSQARPNQLRAGTQAMSAFADEPSGSRAFVGCYELNNSTDVLPMRFALVADSAGAGLSQVRYLDSTGAITERIADAAWSIENGRAVIRTVRRGSILSLSRSDAAVTGESINGPRTGRLTACR